MNRAILDGAALLAAAALYLWARADAADAATGLPPLPVRGAALTAAVRDTIDDDLPEPIRGLGTVDDPFELPFHLFAFVEYDPPSLRPDRSALTPEVFPEAIRGYDGTVIAIEGFMLATTFDGEKLTRFMLSRYPAGCCFGGTPVLDEWIDVSLADDGGDPPGAYSAQLRVVGELEIGEARSENGDVLSLYRMKNARFETVW